VLPLLSLSLVDPHLIRIGIERLGLFEDVIALRENGILLCKTMPYCSDLEGDVLLLDPKTKFLSISLSLIPWTKTKFLSLVPTPGEIAPQYQTTVISSDDVAATAALKGSHEQGAPACSS
jgi:hypothetical protein